MTYRAEFSQSGEGMMAGLIAPGGDHGGFAQDTFGKVPAGVAEDGPGPLGIHLVMRGPAGLELKEMSKPCRPGACVRPTWASKSRAERT